jgi:hypothetical protein
MLIRVDVASSRDRNVIKKEAENTLKYKDLTIEIQHMWNLKTKVIPVIIGATGTIPKSFRKYVGNIPGNHEVKNGVNAGTSDMKTRNSNTRRAATRCSLGIWFVSGIQV